MTIEKYPIMDELHAFRKFYERYRLTPSIVLGKSLRTQQFTVGATAIPIIRSIEPRMYVISSIDPANPVFIGGPGVTVVSGYAILPASSPVIFAMTENAELWAVASAEETLFLIDMGI